MSNRLKNRLKGGGGGSFNWEAGTIFFIGNATVLIRYAGFTILTDPAFSHRQERVSIGYGMHSTRLTNPAMEIDDLPPLDLMVLSHFHAAHFDQIAARELDKSLPIVTTPEAAKKLSRRGFWNAKPLNTWSSVTAEKGGMTLRMTSMPGSHGPALASLVLPEVMGTMFEFTSSGHTLWRIYLTGDTLVVDDVNEIPRRYPEIDLALLHLGGTRLLGMLVTMDAKQGVEMLRIVKPRQAIPIHYNDYDWFKSSLAEFQHEVHVAGLDDRIRYLSRGESHTFKVPPAYLKAS